MIRDCGRETAGGEGAEGGAFSPQLSAKTASKEAMTRVCLVRFIILIIWVFVFMGKNFRRPGGWR